MVEGVHLSGMAADLPDGRRPSTVANPIRSIKVLSSWCAKETYLTADPLDRLGVPDIPETIIATFSEEQVRAMLSWLRQP